MKKHNGNQNHSTSSLHAGGRSQTKMLNVFIFFEPFMNVNRIFSRLICRAISKPEEMTRATEGGLTVATNQTVVYGVRKIRSVKDQFILFQGDRIVKYCAKSKKQRFQRRRGPLSLWLNIIPQDPCSKKQKKNPVWGHWCTGGELVSITWDIYGWISSKSILKGVGISLGPS